MFRNHRSRALGSLLLFTESVKILFQCLFRYSVVLVKLCSYACYIVDTQGNLKSNTVWLKSLVSTVRSERTVQTKIWPRDYKKKFMLNSAEHGISDAHKYKNIKKFSFFSG